MDPKPLPEHEIKELWVSYHDIQYQRIAAHETQRLVFSNLVILLTVVLISFGGSVEDEELRVIVLVPVLVFVLNVTAVIYIHKSRRWVKFHQDQARNLRAKVAPELVKATKEIERPFTSRDGLRRTILQQSLHIVLIVVGILYPLWGVVVRLDLLPH